MGSLPLIMMISLYLGQSIMSCLCAIQDKQPYYKTFGLVSHPLGGMTKGALNAAKPYMSPGMRLDKIGGPALTPGFLTGIKKKI